MNGKRTIWGRKFELFEFDKSGSKWGGGALSDEVFDETTLIYTANRKSGSDTLYYELWFDVGLYRVEYCKRT